MNLDQQKPGEKSGKRKEKKTKKKEKKGSKSEQVRATEELIGAAMASDDAAEAELATAALAETPETAETEAPAPVAEIARPAEIIAPVKVAAPADAAQASPAPEPVALVASFRERMASVAPPADTSTSKPPVQADIAQAVPAATPVAGIQAIASAYRDYTRKSLADAQSFAEKLSAARSLDKAVEAQAEYAQKACENFVADSRKIGELHRELFWQTFRPYWPLGKSR